MTHAEVVMSDRQSILEFLRARLDEDEQAARVAAPWLWTPTAEADEIIAIDAVTVADGFALSGRQLRVIVDHIARWDPARVLAEVETKRQILKMHKPVPTGYGAEPPWEDRDSIQRVCPSCGVSDGWHDVVAPCPTLRALALPYADHPDYDRAWAPQEVAP